MKGKVVARNLKIIERYRRVGLKCRLSKACEHLTISQRIFATSTIDVDLER